MFQNPLPYHLQALIGPRLENTQQKLKEILV